MSKTFICIWLVLLILIATYIRIHGVGEYHYNEDEMLHVEIAGGASLQEVLRFSLYEAHPPLGHLLRHYWQEISAAAWFGRCLSLLFGLLLIPLYYRIGTLLKGEWAGIGGATLIVFGYGCILQSYIVRNYTIFLLFLSVSFYCYILWRMKRRNLDLFCYGAFAALACLTHFSGILAAFSIAAYESIALFLAPGSKKQYQIQWIAVNLLVAAAAITTYYIWTKYGIVVQKPYFSVSSLTHLLLAVLINPLKSAEYVLPCMEIIPVVIFLWFLPPVRNDKKLQQFALFSVIPLLLGMVLVGTGYYFPAGTRHNIWILPFIIPILGWIIGNSAAASAEWMHKKLRLPGKQIIMPVILLTGLIMYSPEKRFADSEYAIKEKDWVGISDYLSTLHPTDLVIAARDNTALFNTIYPSPVYLTPAASTITYRNTRILFSPYYRRISTEEVFETILKEAKKNGVLEEVDTLIFMETLWDGLPEPSALIPRLIACPLLDKRIISFPTSFSSALSMGKAVPEEEIKISPVVFIAISKRIIFDQVISPTGSAHSCLEKKYAL